MASEPTVDVAPNFDDTPQGPGDQSDQRSVQLRSVQEQPVSQANFPVLVPQGQGQRQGLGRPVVVRHDDIDSLFNEEEFSVDLDNEAVLKEKQARSEVLDKVAEFCNLDRQDPQIQKEVMRMRLPAYDALLRNPSRFPCLGTAPRFLLPM